MRVKNVNTEHAEANAAEHQRLQEHTSATHTSTMLGVLVAAGKARTRLSSHVVQTDTFRI